MDKPTPKKTLGPVSIRLIQALRREGKNIFTLADATGILAKSRVETAKFLSGLVKREVLARIKSGVYIILNIGEEEAQMSNWPILARELASPNEYFISHYGAMRLHGMTTHPLLHVYITIPKRQRTKKINNITYHFIYSKETYFWGACVYWASKQEKVMVSDIQKTILDGLARPELCGGLIEVIRGIWLKQKEIDWNKLLKYSKKFQTKSAIKRLGFILESLNLGEDIVERLNKQISELNDYVLLDPHGDQRGKYLKRWKLKININPEEIKESIWG